MVSTHVESWSRQVETAGIIRQVIVAGNHVRASSTIVVRRHWCLNQVFASLVLPRKIASSKSNTIGGKPG